MNWISHVSKGITLFAAFIGNITIHPYDFCKVKIPPSIQRSVEKRQKEFIAGRLCAQAACNSLNFEDNVVGQDSQGRPIWPPNLVGSITHSNTLAIAAVARTSQVKSIGIDSENLTSDKRTISSIKNHVITKNEENLIDDEEDYLLLFSLKESLYKCLNPIINRPFHFQDVEVVKIDREKGSASLKFCSAGIFPKCIFPAYYSLDTTFRHVHSCVLITEASVRSDLAF